MDTEKKPEYGVGHSGDPTVEGSGVVENLDGLQRRLSNRQIQWIAIGGSIGTALFVSIGWGLVEGGPGSLFIAFTVYSLMMALVNSTMAEMAVAHPVSGGFVRQASYWVDEVRTLNIMRYTDWRADPNAGVWLHSGLELLPLRGDPDTFRNICAEYRLDILER